MEEVRQGQGPACRSCGASLEEEVADLGLVPLATTPIRPGAPLRRPLRCAPLRALVCGDCRLVQVPGVGPPLPGSVLRLRQGFAGVIAARLRLGPGTPVAAFDAAMLGPFRDRDIPARAVQSGTTTALRLRDASPPPVLLLAGTLLATATDLHDAVKGVRALLAPGGVAVFDIPDLLGWMGGNRLDLLSHALPMLPSVLVAEMLLGQHGLVPFEVEAIPGPGPWLRLLARHAEDATKPVSRSILARRAAERTAGLETTAAYARAAVMAAEARLSVLDLLVSARRDGRRVAGYGVDAAVVTLAAACGLGPGLVALTVDPDAERNGLVLPGSTLPVRPPDWLDRDPPDLLIVLDGTPAEAVRAALARDCRWQGRVAQPLPSLHIS